MIEVPRGLWGVYDVPFSRYRRSKLALSISEKLVFFREIFHLRESTRARQNLSDSNEIKSPDRALHSYSKTVIRFSISCPKPEKKNKWHPMSFSRFPKAKLAIFHLKNDFKVAISPFSHGFRT